MYNTSKICDAADWFDPDVKLIIENELKETARFHRKQWEFAMIFLTIQKLGLLNQEKIGLSLGGGNERVLYSIAKHIQKLFVTDLYDDSTSWDCARTNDPDEFIKASKPFPLDDNKIQALKMDMRFLDFDDNSFDFCYSSCAIEHIGEHKDFLQHFNEVNRVLKEGGIYVLTTELQFGDRTICDENNFVFSKDYISDLISESNLEFISDVDTDLTKNIINYPYPSNIKNLALSGNKSLNQKIVEEFPHLVLLRGNVPFTSVLLVLRKGVSYKKLEPIRFLNYDNTKRFLLDGVDNYRKLLHENKISISPFSSLPNGVSRFFIDHADYFSNQTNQIKTDKNVFHSDYYWLGSGKSKVLINFKVEEVLPDELNVIQLRIHSYSTYESTKVKCIYEKDITLTNNQLVNEVIEMNTDDNFNYAFLCNLVSGNISCSSITIESYSMNGDIINSVSATELQGVA